MIDTHTHTHSVRSVIIKTRERERENRGQKRWRRRRWPLARRGLINEGLKHTSDSAESGAPPTDRKRSSPSRCSLIIAGMKKEGDYNAIGICSVKEVTIEREDGFLKLVLNVQSKFEFVCLTYKYMLAITNQTIHAIVRTKMQTSMFLFIPH